MPHYGLTRYTVFFSGDDTMLAYSYTHDAAGGVTGDGIVYCPTGQIYSELFNHNGFRMVGGDGGEAPWPAPVLHAKIIDFATDCKRKLTADPDMTFAADLMFQVDVLCFFGVKGSSGDGDKTVYDTVDPLLLFNGVDCFWSMHDAHARHLQPQVRLFARALAQRPQADSAAAPRAAALGGAAAAARPQRARRAAVTHPI